MQDAGGNCPEVSPWEFTGKWQEGKQCTIMQEQNMCSRAGEFSRLGLRMGTLDAADIFAFPLHPDVSRSLRVVYG